ncbi:MAG: serine/threonine protein kinase [Satyrvirus sp.]|uniref:Serine/threonine protein kinase n=1 Tax=Satyrvirus sp. TaxID=2487771 RepID=A0A3G5ADE7_9VIRU|nr:MAG: serine/threonine protein kinase [Satyrvirus sp.]
MQYNIDYMLPLLDYSIPMKNGLTKESLKQIFNNSYFKKWLGEHSYLLKNFPDKYQTINEYCNPEVINEYYARDAADIKKKFRHPVKKYKSEEIRAVPIPVMTGGNTPDDETQPLAASEETLPINSINVLATIIFSHSVDLAETGKQRKRTTTESEQLNIILKSPLSFDEIRTLASPKNKRLVYQIGSYDKKFVLKITIPTENYINEMNIYKDLLEYDDIKDNLIQPFYLKCINIDNIDKIFFGAYGNGYFIDPKFFENVKNDVVQMFKNFNEKYKSNVTDCCIMILEYQEKYLTLYDYLINYNNVSCNFVKKTIDILQNLNTNKGFAHMDLHSSNLLVDVIRVEPILYDFDFSMTSNVDNNIYYNATEANCPYEKDKCKNLIEILKSDKVKYGFVIDFLKFFKSSRANINCAVVGKEVADTIKTYAEKKYTPKQVNEFEINTVETAIKIGPEAGPLFQNGASSDPFYYKYQKYKTKYFELLNNTQKN